MFFLGLYWDWYSDMADDLSLAPLQIGPGMMPPQAPPPAQPVPQPAPANTNDTIAQLNAMFPDFDKDVIGSVLGLCDGNMDAALEQLLEMGGGPPAGAAGGPPSGNNMNEDEQLARAMDMEFATQIERELGLQVPDVVRSDPEMYQAFIASALADAEERAVASGAGGAGGSAGQQPASIAERVFASQQQNSGSLTAKHGGGSGGMAGFLDRFRGKASKTTPMMSSTRVKVIAVGSGDEKKEGMRAGLLENADKI